MAVQGVHLWEGVVVFGGLIILVLSFEELHIELDQLEPEATP